MKNNIYVLKRPNNRPIGRRFLTLALMNLVLFMVSGCFFSGDNKKEIPVATVAPSADFSLDKSSGVVSFTVNFTDLSTPGSSPITSWVWDFGDGESSQQQNPQHIYNTVGVFDVSLSVTTNDGQDMSSKIAAVTTSAAITELKLTVVDVKGRVIEGVVASSETFNINSQSYSNNKQLILDIAENDASGVIHLTKPGYVSGSLYVDGVLGSSASSITLMELNQPIVFDASVGGYFTAKDGATLLIAADVLMHSDGSDVVGDVELYITPIDVSDSIEKEGFPGSYLGISEVPIPGEQPLEIASYGAVQMSMFQAGDKLQLKNNRVAALEIPIYVNKHLNGNDIMVNDTIPLWILNETTGIWERQGTGKVRNNSISPTGKSLLVNTAHFSWFNTDIRIVDVENVDNDAPACELIMMIEGAEQGHFYTRGIRIETDDQPVYTQQQRFRYVGEQLSDFIPSHNDYEVYISGERINENGETIAVSDTKTVRCIPDQPVLNVLFNLQETPLRLINFYVLNSPVFELVGTLNEITKNNILVKPSFEGTANAVITSPLINTSVSLLDQGVLEIVYLAEDPTPTTVTATLTKNENTIEESLAVQYISELAPEVTMAIAYHLGDNTVFQWNEVGADVLIIESFNPDDLFELTLDGNTTEYITGRYQGYQGNLKLTFRNRYGDTMINTRVSQNCFPDSENPCPE